MAYGCRSTLRTISTFEIHVVINHTYILHDGSLRILMSTPTFAFPSSPLHPVHMDPCYDKYITLREKFLKTNLFQVRAGPVKGTETRQG